MALALDLAESLRENIFHNLSCCGYFQCFYHLLPSFSPTLINKYYSFLLCVWIFPLHVCLSTMMVSGGCGDQQMDSGALCL